MIPREKGSNGEHWQKKVLPHWQMAGLNLEAALWARPSEPPAREEPVGHHHYGVSKEEGWKERGSHEAERRKEGRRETEEETRGESLRSPVALTRLFPAETSGPLPPTGPQTSAEWKISVEHPGNDPNTLRHTETHKQTLAQKTSRLQHSCPKNRIQYSYSMQRYIITNKFLLQVYITDKQVYIMLI